MSHSHIIIKLPYVLLEAELPYELISALVGALIFQRVQNLECLLGSQLLIHEWSSSCNFLVGHNILEDRECRIKRDFASYVTTILFGLESISNTFQSYVSFN